MQIQISFIGWAICSYTFCISGRATIRHYKASSCRCERRSDAWVARLDK
jgi:hypothetical protein